MSVLSQFLREHLLPCPYKANFDMECPGCGFQRSFIALLEGDPATSLQLYPALLPLLSVWILVPLHLIFKFRYGAIIIKYLFLFSALIIAAGYFFKLINHTLIA